MTTILSIAALLIALLAVAYAWRLHQEVERATARLDRYNRALFQTNDDIRQLREQLATVSAEARVATLRNGGSVAFAPSMTVREAHLLHPQTQQVLSAFHLGGCSNCAVDPEATLAAISRDHGIDQAQLLASLNQLFGQAQPANGVAVNLTKVPNVQVEF